MGFVGQEEDNHSSRLSDVIAVSVIFLKRAEFSLQLNPHHSLNSALVRHFLFVSRILENVLDTQDPHVVTPQHLKVF